MFYTEDSLITVSSIASARYASEPASNVTLKEFRFRQQMFCIVNSFTRVSSIGSDRLASGPVSNVTFQRSSFRFKKFFQYGLFLSEWRLYVDPACFKPCLKCENLVSQLRPKKLCAMPHNVGVSLGIFSPHVSQACVRNCVIFVHANSN
jgi:hypothetical protein